jgi:hypothetical protein
VTRTGLLKQVVKKGRVTLNQRVVPPQVRVKQKCGTSQARISLSHAVGCIGMCHSAYYLQHHLHCIIVVVLLQAVVKRHGMTEAAVPAVEHALTAGNHVYALFDCFVQAMAKWQGSFEAAEPDVI